MFHSDRFGLVLRPGLLDIAHHALNFWRPGPPRKELNCRRRTTRFTHSVAAGYPAGHPIKYVSYFWVNMCDRFGLRADGILGAYLLLFWPALTMRRFLWGRRGAECLALHRFGLVLARGGRRRSIMEESDVISGFTHSFTSISSSPVC